MASTDYVPRHAWVDPAEVATAAVPAGVSVAVPVAVLETPEDGTEPMIVDTHGDFVPVSPSKPHRWRMRKSA